MKDIVIIAYITASREGFWLNICFLEVKDVTFVLFFKNASICSCFSVFNLDCSLIFIKPTVILDLKSDLGSIISALV